MATVKRRSGGRRRESDKKKKVKKKVLRGNSYAVALARNQVDKFLGAM